MGPVMNILLAIVVMAVVLYQGAQLPAFEQQPVVIGTFAAQFGCRTRRPEARATASSPSTARRSRRGNSSRWRSSRRPSGKSRLATCATASTAPSTWFPDAQGKFEMGDIGVQPVVHPEVVAVSKGQPAEEAGLQGGDVVLAAGGENRHRLRAPARGDQVAFPPAAADDGEARRPRAWTSSSRRGRSATR